jgi:hypothetical protein
VWQQLCPDNLPRAVSTKMVELEAELRQRLVTVIPQSLYVLCMVSTIASLLLIPWPSHLFYCPLLSSPGLACPLLSCPLLSCLALSSPLLSSIFLPRLLLSCASLQLPVPARTDSEASTVFKRSDATVVLFYDHLTHCTPDEHVESIARYGAVYI